MADPPEGASATGSEAPETLSPEETKDKDNEPSINNEEEWEDMRRRAKESPEEELLVAAEERVSETLGGTVRHRHVDDTS